MPRTDYPTAIDLQGILSQAGISITDPATLASAVAAGISAFETSCSRHFLAGKAIDNTPEAEATRQFDPPMPHETVLWLGPFNDVTTVTSVVHQAKPDGQPVELVADRDYFLEPVNNPSRGLGYDRLRRSRWASWTWHGWGAVGWSGMSWLSGIQSIRITGLWGYGNAIPDDAWLAMAYSAVLQVEGANRLLTTGGRVGYSVTGAVQETFGVESYQTIINGWMGHIDKAAAYYRQVEF